MKSIQVDLPDRVADEIDALIRDGWFSAESEVVRLALIEFLRSHRYALEELYQREDIAWAPRQRA